MISEVLTSIKLIKMYAWEESFAKVIYGEKLIYCLFVCCVFLFRLDAYWYEIKLLEYFPGVRLETLLRAVT